MLLLSRLALLLLLNPVILLPRLRGLMLLLEYNLALLLLLDWLVLLLNPMILLLRLRELTLLLGHNLAL